MSRAVRVYSGSPRAAIRSVIRTRSNWLLYVTVSLIAFSYVPYEIGLQGRTTTDITLVLVIYLGYRYKVLHAHLDAVESAVAVLAAYIVIRLLVDLGFQGASSSLTLLQIEREVSKLLSAVIIYRVAQRRDLTQTICLGAMTSLLAISALIFYQLHEGALRLLSHGYTTAAGFNYLTASNLMRPFGPFYSPTVCGAYLAMTLGFVWWAPVPTKWRWVKWGILAAGIIALLKTDTRAAWVSVVVGMLIVALIQTESRKARVMITLIPFALALVVLVVADPHIFSSIESRISTLFQSGFSSNADRRTLWAGTLNAVGSSSHTLLFGYGSAVFFNVLIQYIPASVAGLGHPHETYLIILYQYGAIGLLIYLYMLTRIFQKVLTAAKRHSKDFLLVSASLAAIFMFLTNSFFEELWTGYNFIVTLFLFVGIGVSRRTIRPASVDTLPGATTPLARSL